MAIHIAQGLNKNGETVYCLVEGVRVLSDHPTVQAAIAARRLVKLPLPEAASSAPVTVIPTVESCR